MNDNSDRPHDAGTAIAKRAAVVAARLDTQAPAFRNAIASASAEYDALLETVATLGPAYAFERAGRPGAIEAVRQALPVVERELFDAILDDFACERAAVEEALYRVALMLAQRRRDAR